MNLGTPPQFFIALGSVEPVHSCDESVPLYGTSVADRQALVITGWNPNFSTESLDRLAHEVSPHLVASHDDVGDVVRIPSVELWLGTSNSGSVRVGHGIQPRQQWGTDARQARLVLLSSRLV